jgi:hypothetical protein
MNSNFDGGNGPYGNAWVGARSLLLVVVTLVILLAVVLANGIGF